MKASNLYSLKLSFFISKVNDIRLGEWLFTKSFDTKPFKNMMKIRDTLPVRNMYIQNMIIILRDSQTF